MSKKKNMTYEGRMMVGRPCAGQRRYVAAKRTALDGKVWWCVFDHKKNKYVGGKYKHRRDCEYGIGHRIRGGELEISPNDYDKNPDEFKTGKHTFLVSIRWAVEKCEAVEATTAEEARDIVKKRVDEGDVCVWNDGFETTDDVDVDTVGEEKNDGSLDYYNN